MKLRIYGFKATRRQMLIVEAIVFILFTLIAAYFFFFRFQNEYLSGIERKNGLILFFIFLAVDFWIIIEAQFFFNRFTVLYLKHIESQRNEIEVQKREIIDSINYARRIQKAILPPTRLVREYLGDSFILYKPKDVVAGDFYWMEKSDNKILFAAADCTGHGVPGAMVSVVCNNALNRSVREFKLSDPGEILDKTRELLLQEFDKAEEDVKDGMDISLCVMEGNMLHFAGAYNPLWLIRKEGPDKDASADYPSFIELKPDKQPIGKFDNPFPFNSQTIELREGDTIYIFSDGYADQFGGEKGKKFMVANFKKLLISIQNEAMEKQKEIIDMNFESWKGDLEQIDDVCVIGLKIHNS